MRLQSHQEEHWIPLADLMTGMMMLFLLIAIFFMLQMEDKTNDIQVSAAEKELALNAIEKKKAEIATIAQNAQNAADELSRSKERVKKIVTVYTRTKENLYQSLKKEFESDLPNWQAHLEPDLTIRFDNLQTLFSTGSSVLKPEFERILRAFFPRYIRILSSDEYRNTIEEIRIEGHTSTIWQGQKNEDDAYIKNMELSQNRTRLTLQFLLGLSDVDAEKPWIITKLTANGLSSSRPRKQTDGSENQLASQRVEFRVRTNAESKLDEIIQELPR